MFGFFNKKYDNPALLEEMKTRQERWFAFLDKLEARMQELTTAAIPGLREIFDQDTDPYKRAHNNMLQGLLGQINHMRQKASDIQEEQIIDFVYQAEAAVPAVTSTVGRDYHNRIMNFRMACLNRHYIFDEKLNKCILHLQQAAGERNLEAAYQEQLRAFESIRDKFSCQQCGGNITIEKMFFIDTYVTCPFCHSQNTFSPSTGARMVLHDARALAEQRTAHLRRAYEESNPRDPEREKVYLRAMIDEWNKIIPDMAEENEKFYERLLREQSFHHFK